MTKRTRLEVLDVKIAASSFSLVLLMVSFCVTLSLRDEGRKLKKYDTFEYGAKAIFHIVKCNSIKQHISKKVSVKCISCSDIVILSHTVSAICHKRLNRRDRLYWR